MGEPGETTNFRNPKDPLPFGVFALFTPDEAMEKDRPPRLKRRGLVILVCLALMGASWAAAQSAEFVENVYAQGLGQSMARGLAFVSGFVPTSLAEVVLLAACAYLFLPGFVAALHVFQRKRRILNAIAGGFFRFWAFAAVVALTFYLAWGLNYARSPLPQRLGWKAVETPSGDAEYARQTDELARLCAQLVQAANDNYMQAMGSEDFGRPSFPPADSLAFEDALDRGFERVQRRLALEESFAVSRGRAKPVAASILMCYLGIGGFYFPWTGEANYNRLLPAFTQPQIIAHEKAHQRGITSEDEANFLGYLACISSDDAYSRYSGYLFGQRQLLAELYRRDAPRAQALLKQRLPGVQRDVDYLRAWWQQYEGAAQEVSASVNDAYLKSQGVKGGVASYAASQSLIILFARNNGDSAVVELPR